MPEQDILPQPLPLFIAHARGEDRAWHRLCWQMDDRMGRIVFGKKEGAVAAIRLAWWEEALTSDGTKGRGEPMLDQWHALRPGEEDRASVHALAGAWRMLLDPDPMTEQDWHRFGEGRGRMFRLIARGGDAERLDRAGRLWALWDAARLDPDRSRAEGALAAAIAVMDEGIPSRIVPRPLQLAAGMAADDVRARVLPEPDLSFRQYLRLVKRAIFG